MKSESGFSFAIASQPLAIRMVCAFFCSMWQCQEAIEKIGSEKMFPGARRTEGGGSKGIWEMPIWRQHISNGVSLRNSVLFRFDVTMSLANPAPCLCASTNYDK